MHGSGFWYVTVYPFELDGAGARFTGNDFYTLLPDRQTDRQTETDTDTHRHRHRHTHTHTHTHTLLPGPGTSALLP